MKATTWDGHEKERKEKGEIKEKQQRRLSKDLAIGGETKDENGKREPEEWEKIGEKEGRGQQRGGRAGLGPSLASPPIPASISGKSRGPAQCPPAP